MGKNQKFQVMIIGLTALLLLLGAAPKALAQSTGYHLGPEGGYRLAQFDADEAYDPFADYSEFDEAQEEEADINFFRHGRFLTIGILGGIEGFTQGSGQIFQPAPAFGLYLSYFFDMRFALQFAYVTSTHSGTISGGGQSYSGTEGLDAFQVDFKYYLNTQNVSKGLGKINPYIIGGFSDMNRTVSVDQVSGFSKESALGVDIGAGFEIPFFRNKMYFGAQAMYQFTNFPDKNNQIIIQNGLQTGEYLNGDVFTVMGLVGVNF